MIDLRQWIEAMLPSALWTWLGLIVLVVVAVYLMVFFWLGRRK